MDEKKPLMREMRTQLLRGDAGIQKQKPKTTDENGEACNRCPFSLLIGL
jgi:hypothetical protein